MFASSLNQAIRRNYCSIIYICIGVFIFVGIMGQSTLGDYHPDLSHYMHRVEKLFRFILIYLVVDQLRYYGFNFKKFILFLVFMFFVAFSKTYTWLIFDVLFIPLLLNNNLDCKFIYKFSFAIVFFTMLLIFSLYNLDFLPTLEFKKFLLNKAYTLGFRHPNNFGFTLFILGILYFLIRNKIKFYDSLLLFVIFLLCALLSQSKTGSILLLLLVAASVFCIFKKNISEGFQKKLLYLSVFLYIFLIIVLYFLSITEIYRYDFFEKYLPSFAARLYMGQEALYKYGFSLMGQKIRLVGDYEAIKGIRYFVVDSMYFAFPINVGVLPTIMLIVCHICGLRNTIYRNNLRLYIVCMLFIFYEMLECLPPKTGMLILIFMFPFSNGWQDEKQK